MVVIFSGTRKGAPNRILEKVFQEIPKDALFIHGAARGVDMQIDDLCRAHGRDRILIPANWEGRGKAAGPIRNQIMLETAYAIAQKRGCDIQVYAFPADDSKGTFHMINLARSYHIPVGVHRV